MKIYKTPMPEITLKYRRTELPKHQLTSSKEVFNLLLTLYDPDTIAYTETVYVLFLNRRSTTIGWMKISEGGTASVIIDTKVIFSTALCCGASAIVISHNHPSGDTKPSESDVKLTKKLKQAGELLDIALLDHIIVSEYSYFSFADECCMD